MAPNAGKATYRSYEAQARLVRAIVAAHPTVKWDYKEIVACYGSDMTENALNHRFRYLKTEVFIIQEGRKAGCDPKNLGFEGSLPAKKADVDTEGIAKYFGQSTGDGIQFQFRTIKKDAEKLRQVESEGGDVAAALTSELGAGPVGTPSGSAATTPAKTPRRRAPASGSTKKRSLQQDLDFIKREETNEDDGDDEDPFPDLRNPVEDTPSKRPKTTNRTALPKRGAQASAGTIPVRTLSHAAPDAATTADQASQSTNENDTPEPSSAASPAVAASIFGPVSPKKKKASDDRGDTVSPFKSSGVDAYVGSQEPTASMYTNMSFTFKDGEI